MIGIYMRISNWRVNEFASQEQDLQTYAKNQTEEVRWFPDVKSGAEMERPELDKLMYQVRLGEIAKIVVWRLDRLGRNALGLMKLVQELDQHHCNLISLRDGLDLSTASGRLHFNILASVAQFDREVMAERQMAGIAAAHAKGKFWGGRPKGAWSKVSPQCRKVICKEYLDKTPVATIARSVNLCRKHVYTILKEEGLYIK